MFYVQIWCFMKPCYLWYNLDFSQFCCLKGKDCVRGYCSPGTVGAHLFWNDQMEPNESKGLVCAGTVNHKLQLEVKQGCRNCLLRLKTENL